MSKRATNWREKHQLIKEWKKQKKDKKENKNEIKSEEIVIENNETTNETTNEPSIEPSIGRKWTASIAIPASIVDNAQTPELKSYLCGQIARALVVFNIDEVVLFDEYSKQTFGFVFNCSLVLLLIIIISNVLVIQKKVFFMTKEIHQWFK
jgi:hypothetical protein